MISNRRNRMALTQVSPGWAYLCYRDNYRLRIEKQRFLDNCYSTVYHWEITVYHLKLHEKTFFTKELSFCHKFKFSNPNILTAFKCKLLIFQHYFTMKLSLCHKLKFSNPNILGTFKCKPLIFYILNQDYLIS